MRPFTLLAPILLAAAPLAAQSPAPDPAITALLSRLEQAWDRGDAAAWAGEFAPDADAVGVSGAVIHGAAGVLARYTTVFATTMKDAHMVLTLQKARPLGRDAMILDTQQDVTLASGEQRHVRGSWVVQRRSGVWRVVHTHNTSITPPRD